MTLSERIQENPMTWKDWITATGMALTLGTVLLQGGRMLERQDTANARVQELATQAMGTRTDIALLQSELIKQRGVDMLHEERMRMLVADVDELKRKAHR